MPPSNLPSLDMPAEQGKDSGVKRISLGILANDLRELNWFWYLEDVESQNSGARENLEPKARLCCKDLHVSQVKSPAISELLQKYSEVLALPSGDELREVDLFHSTSQVEIETLRQRSRQTILAIEDLCLRLQETEKAIATKHQELAVSDTLRSPIRRLAPELLSSIFEILVFADPGRYRAHHRLTMVCKLWKTITLTNPKLWQALKIVIPSYFSFNADIAESKYRKLAIGLPTILDRLAGKLSLSLTVVDENPPDGGESEDEPDNSLTTQIHEWDSRMIDLCFSTLESCHSLSLSVFNPAWIEKLLQQNPTHFRNLKEVDIVYNGRPLELDPKFYLEDASHLTRFSIAWPSSSYPRMISLPFSQVDTLFCGMAKNPREDVSLPLQSWRTLLLRCSNLRRAEVHFSAAADSMRTAAEDGPTQGTDHTNLEEITILSTFNITLEEVTADIRFSSLKALHLTSSRGKFSLSVSDETAAVILKRNSTLFASLTHLSFLRITISELDLFTLLRGLPLLVSLELLYGAFGRGRTEEELFYVKDQGIVDFLTISDDGSHGSDLLGDPVLPLLRSVCLYEGQSRRGIYPGTHEAVRYSRMALSRYTWAMKQRERRGVQSPTEAVEATRSFDGSPFQFVLKIDPMRLRMTQSRLEKAVGPLHKRVFKAEPQVTSNSKVHNRQVFI